MPTPPGFVPAPASQSTTSTPETTTPPGFVASGPPGFTPTTPFPDTQTPFPSAQEASVAEDIRRVGEWAKEAPGKVKDTALRAAEYVTDFPVTHWLAAKNTQDANKQVNDYFKEKGGPAIPKPEPVITGLDLSPFQAGKDERGNPQGEGSSYGHIDTPDAPRFDVGIPGTDVSARQVINTAAHNTIGRAWKTFQRGPGSTMAELALEATKFGRGVQFDLPLASQTPLPNIHIGTTAETDELLSRELLSFFHGPDWQAKEEDPRYARASTELQSRYGINGAAFAQSFAREVGGLPVFLMSTGAGEMAAAGDRALIAETAAMGPRQMAANVGRAVTAGKTAGIKEGLAEGASQGFLQASTKDGEDVFQGMGMGMLVGGIFGGAAALASTKGTLAQLHGGLYNGAVPGVTSEVDAMVSAATGSGKAKTPGGFLLPPSTTKEFIAQLDDVVAKVTAKGPAKVRPQANVKKAAQNLEEATATGARHTPDLSIEHVEGNPVDPTMSYWAIDDNGQLVMRDVEAVATKVRSTRQSKSRPVEVQKKGQVGTRIIEPDSGASGGQLVIKVRKRDTPVKDTEALQRLALQAGRRVVPGAASQEAEAAVFRLLQQDELSHVDDTLGGTAEYTPPEVAKEWVGVERQNEALKNLQDRPPNQPPKASPKPSPRDNVPTKLGKRQRAAALADTFLTPQPVAITTTPEGKITTTVIRASPPKRPDNWVMEPGDPVMVDGEVPAQVVGFEPDGPLTVELTAPGKRRVKVAPASVTHAPAEFQVPPHEGKPIASYDPEVLVDQRTLAIIKGTTQGTTIPRLMQVSGRSDPTWAAMVLRHLEDQGVVYEAEPGLFRPTRATGVETTAQGEKAGYAVYIGTGGAMGKGQIGILRGRDPRNNGNWLVERPDFPQGVIDHPVGDRVFARTKVESVPEAEVRTMKPVGYSDRQMAQAGVDLEGWTKPMPPSYYQASEATLGDLNILSKLYSKIEQQPGFFQRSLQGMKEALAGNMHTAPVDLRLSKAQQLWGMAGMVKSEGMARTKLLADKLELGSAASHEFTKVMEAQRSRSPSGTTELNHAELQQWAKNYPEAAQGALTDFKKMVAESDEYTQYLAQRGVTNIETLDMARKAGLLEEYLTRNYQAFMMPRADWAAYARKNMTQEWENAVRWLTEHRPASEFSNPAAELDELLRLDNPIKALEDKGYIKAEGTKKLISRERVPEPFRRLLGEHRDAAVKLGYTVAYQRQLVKGIQAWDDIAAHPTLWSPGWRPDMSLKVPDQPIYGNARNGFLPDNAATRALLGDRLLTTSDQAPAFLRAMGWLGRKWKAGHTVYNQVSWVNNAVRNIKGVLLSGGYDTPADFQGFRDAAQMLRGYGNDPTIYGPNKLLVEAMDYDVVVPGLAGTELALEQRNFASKMLRVLNKSRPGHSPFFDAMAEVGEKVQEIPEKIHNGYDFVDKWARFGSYLNIRRKLLAKGYSVDEAAQMASLEVNKRFQSFQRTPDWARKMSGNMALAAPFLSSKLEDLRINATLVGDAIDQLTNPMAGTDRALLFRMAAVSALFGGTAYLANSVRRNNGISDAQDDVGRSNIPLRTKQKNPFLIGSLDYDAHKRRLFYDMSSYEDLLTSWKGNSQDPLAARILFNNVQDVVGPQSFMGAAVNAVAGQTGLIHGQQVSDLPRADQTGLIELAKKYGPGFMPQGPLNVLRNLDKLQPTGRLVNPEALTPDQALAQDLTGRVNAVVGPQSHKQVLMETAGNVRHQAQNVGKAAADAALQGVSSDRQKYMIQSNVRELKKSINIPRPLKSTTNLPPGFKPKE